MNGFIGAWIHSCRHTEILHRQFGCSGGFGTGSRPRGRTADVD